MNEKMTERIAQIIAHRACCGTEHDPRNGKFHGCCIVCGVPWPCAYAGKPPATATMVSKNTVTDRVCALLMGCTLTPEEGNRIRELVSICTP